VAPLQLALPAFPGQNSRLFVCRLLNIQPYQPVYVYINHPPNVAQPGRYARGSPCCKLEYSKSATRLICQHILR